MFSFKFHSNFIKNIPACFNLIYQQSRSTFILRRKWPPPLHKQDRKPNKLRARHMVYDLVEDTNIAKQSDLKIILKQYVDGVGNAGDILTLRPYIAYRDYLMTGLAVYGSPENLAKYKVDKTKPKLADEFSSPYVKKTINGLNNLLLEISMNKLQPWVLEPWHVKASFRKSGYVVPEYAIEMPPVQIKGPDLSLKDKEFYVTITINNKEKVKVRCKIHHWATGLDRLPWEEFHWKKPLEPLIPEQAEVLSSKPLSK